MAFRKGIILQAPAGTTYCVTVWTSTYTCATGLWSAPTVFSAVAGQPLSADIPWAMTGLLVAQTTVVSPGACVAIAPLTPTFPPPFPGCPCCKSVFLSTWDCVTLTWGVPVLQSQTAGVLCAPDIDWAYSGLCSAIKTIYTAGACPSVVPAVPLLAEPPGCCPTGGCCKKTWQSTYDCNSGVWSNPVLIFQDPYAPCSADVDWVVVGCVATYIQYDRTLNGAC